MAQVRTRSRGPREADTCHDYILPRLRDAGWRDEQIIEEHHFRDRRIAPTVCGLRREPAKQAGYLPKIEPGFRSESSRPNADGYTSALTGAHYFVLSTESLRGVIEPVD